MKRAMLSQPMAGKTDDEIKETREKAIKTLENKGYEIGTAKKKWPKEELHRFPYASWRNRLKI